MKRIISILIAISLCVAIAPTAFAHGHHGSRTRNGSISNSRAPAVCAVESCALVETHTHNGTTYYSHYYGDGHAYHEYCSVADCTVDGYHGHDGVYCFGHTAYDGHGYHTAGGFRHH